MKRRLAIILLGCMFLIVGCGSANTESTNKQENNNTHVSEEETTDQSMEISMDVLKKAKETSKDSFQYFINDDGNYTISEYFGEDTIVVVPDEIDGIPVTYIASGVFSGNETLEAIKIGDNIVALESKAFLNCFNLKYVILGENVKSIGEYCFGSTKIEEMELNEGLEKLDYCSIYVKTLKELFIPNSVIEIDAAFATTTVIHVNKGSYAETYMIGEIEKYPDAGYEYVVK